MMMPEQQRRNVLVRRVILFVLGLALAIYVLVNCLGRTPQVNTRKPSAPVAPATSIDSHKYEDAVNKLLGCGLVVKVNPELNEAYVEGGHWNATNVDEKKTVGYVLGHYCGLKKGTNLNWVEIKDYNTGRRLMKWSQAWGVTFD